MVDLERYFGEQNALAAKLAPEVYEIWTEGCYHIKRGGGEYRKPWLEWRDWDWLRLEETECPKWEPNYSDVFEPFKAFSDIPGYNVGSELLIKFPTFLGGGEMRFLDEQYSRVYFEGANFAALTAERGAAELQVKRAASLISDVFDSIQSVLRVWYVEAIKTPSDESISKSYLRHAARAIWREILYPRFIDGKTKSFNKWIESLDNWILSTISLGVPKSLAKTQKIGVDYYTSKRNQIIDPVCKFEARRLALEYAIYYKLLDKPMPKWSDVVAKKPSGREKHLENKDWVKDRFEKLAASGDFDSNDKIYRQVAEDYSYKFVKQISISQIQRYVGHRQ